MQIRLLGPVEFIGNRGERIPLAGKKVRGLVAVLALDVGHVVTPQRLIDTLWGEQEVHGANGLQVLVSKLRRALANAGEDNVITTHPAGYALDLEPSTIDLARFESLTSDARQRPAEQAATMLREALALWRGSALGGLPDTERTAAMRSRLDELRQAALDDLTDIELELGGHHTLVGDLEQRISDDPLRERRWGQLIKALYGSGRQADAVRAFQRAREVLIEQIGAEPGPELRRLEAAVLAHDDELLVAPKATASGPIGVGFRRRGNLRLPVDVCVGRVAALAELDRLADRHRLITMVGPGGVGKSRLAQEFGIGHSEDFADGVWWVELAPGRSAADVAGALQRTLGIEGGPVTDHEAALDAVVAILRDRHALMILDNCEHLVDELQIVVAELLGRCPGLRVTTTSRQPLDIAGERLFDVAPLSSDAALALFTARTGGIVESSPETENTIRDICDRLDRLPLALELAAARTRYFQLDEIRSRLSNRFELLREGSRGAQAHQRNLRAVADWSYELLDELERRVFERLSVFADGAPASGAIAVCSGHDVPADSVERLLHRLVDQSLIVADRSGAGTRYRMLQTLADYAAERLELAGGTESTRRMHAEWVRDLAATVAFGAPTDGATVAAVHDEDAAVRDAVSWSIEHDAHLALEICNALAAFWFGTMRVSSGWELLSAALDANIGSSDERLRASAQAWAGVFATMLQDLETARVHAQAALDTEQRLADPVRLGTVTLLMALAAGYRNDPEWRRWVARSRTHFARAGVSGSSGHASFAEGAVELLRDNLQAAADHLHTAVFQFREHRDHLGLILAVSRLGELAWRTGDVDLFADMHTELLELGAAGRSTGVTTGALARLGHARLAQGNLAEAQVLARDALAGSGSSFMPVINGYVFKTAGLVNLALGHVEEGRHHLAASIEAFSRGAGNLGVGQAALCWIDLSASHADAGELDDALRTAGQAVQAAEQSGEPWVLSQARKHLERTLEWSATAPDQ